jgi:excisionase family DNA binding protein
MTTTVDRQPIPANGNEGRALQRLDAMLQGDGAAQIFRLIGAQDEELTLPQSVITALRQLAHYLASGEAVAIVPINETLTTQEAADILNISRPYLIKLLNEGALPFTKVGTHRRIQFEDVMAYKQRRDADRQRVLDVLAALNEEMGQYDS